MCINVGALKIEVKKAKKAHE